MATSARLLLPVLLVVVLLPRAARSAPGQPTPPLLLDHAGLATLRSSQQPAVVRFSWPGCQLCSQLDDFWGQMSPQLPPGSTWYAECGATPDVCEACGVLPPPRGLHGDVEPILKAWTGEHFVAFDAGEGGLRGGGPQSIIDWIKDYANWDLDAPGVGALDAASPPDNTASLVPGKLQPWTGQALPLQIFIPTAPRTGLAAERGLRPVVLYFHGGNDGPWAPMNQQALAYQLVTNATYAASFPFIAIMPCTECVFDGTMVPYGNNLYEQGPPNFGEVGFTPRNLLLVDRVLAAALTHFGGDPERVILTSTSYGGRGLYWYASGRPNVFAALVPMAASIPPNPALAAGICCRSGAAECCPAVWQFVGANDKPGMVQGHDEWDRIYKDQQRSGQRTTDYKYTRYEWAPPPRQKEYSYMTGHAPYELAWPDPSLQEWMLEQRCPGCTGPSLVQHTGPDLSWKRSVVQRPVSEGSSRPAASASKKKKPTKTTEAQKGGEMKGRRRKMKEKKQTKQKKRKKRKKRVRRKKRVKRRRRKKRSTQEDTIENETEDPLLPAAAGPETPLHAAARKGDLKTVRKLLRQGASMTAQVLEDKSRTPLHVAAHHGRQAIVKLLLEHDAPVNAGEVANWRPLHEVAHTGHMGIAELLLASGADVNAVANGGWTSLHQASGNGHPDLVTLFLDHGAVIDRSSDKEKLTPLHIAAQMRQDQVARVLIKQGADAALIDHAGFSALQYAERVQHQPTMQVLSGDVGEEGASRSHERSSSTRKRERTPKRKQQGTQRGKQQRKRRSKEQRNQPERAAAGTSTHGDEEHPCGLEDIRLDGASVAWKIPPACEVVDLTRAGIGIKGAKALALALEKGGGRVRSLKISFNQLTDAGVVVIADALRNHHVPKTTRLELAANGMTAKGAAVLGKALSEHGGVDYLELSGNQFGDSGVSALASTYLEKNAVDLTLIGLHATGITDIGAARLAKAVPSTALAYLGLNKNRIQDEGAAALAIALKTPGGKVRTLKLNGNEIGDDGAVALANAAAVVGDDGGDGGGGGRDSVQLLDLQLSQNDRIKGIGAAAIARARRINPRIGPVTLGGGAGDASLSGVAIAGALATAAGGDAEGGADEALWQNAEASAFVLFTTAECASCVALEKAWNNIAATGIPDVSGSMHGRMYVIDCEAQEGLCGTRGVVLHSGQPVVEAWGTGGHPERYAGARNLPGLVAFIAERLGLEDREEWVGGDEVADGEEEQGGRSEL